MMIFMTPFKGTFGTSVTLRTQSRANSFSIFRVLTSERLCGVKYDVTLQLTRRVAFFIDQDAIDILFDMYRCCTLHEQIVDASCNFFECVLGCSYLIFPYHKKR